MLFIRDPAKVYTKCWKEKKRHTRQIFVKKAYANYTDTRRRRLCRWKTSLKRPQSNDKKKYMLLKNSASDMKAKFDRI